jgi:hypothetical protein
MHNPEQIVTDQELEKAWGNANFGNMQKRDVIKGALLKCASGYLTGHTVKCILEELQLVTTRWTLTKKGKQYLFAAFSQGVSV